ncbi:hypothetical protein O181_041727 [Austropuccinia psidii MF-1]|uniref:Ribosomal RNA-processing protein 14/surfeit locus protein 6 C-terminal domain-containing protein n=1 Tax=Austropuccinia psidii MF-1 TaxID=1389203 RepID=A0A9Q3DH96_9BASI|nr:hypothetical protein [Austropuccinia psidii MF-1]
MLSKAVPVVRKAYLMMSQCHLALEDHSIPILKVRNGCGEAFRAPEQGRFLMKNHFPQSHGEIFRPNYFDGSFEALLKLSLKIRPLLPSHDKKSLHHQQGPSLLLRLGPLRAKILSTALALLGSVICICIVYPLCIISALLFSPRGFQNSAIDAANLTQKHTPMDSPKDLEALRASIFALDKDFQDLMCRIPAKYYIPSLQLRPLSVPVKSGRKPTKKIKKQQKLEAEAKRLQKRTKYDPDTLPTIPQLQGLNDCRHSKLNTQSPSAEGLTNDPEEENDGNTDAQKAQTTSSHTQLSRAELQEKLKQRIDQLQSKSRRQSVATQGEATITSKDDLLELAKQKRDQIRDRKRRERKEAKKKAKTSNSRSTSGSGNLNKGDQNTQAAQASHEPNATCVSPTIPNQPSEQEAKQTPVKFAENTQSLDVTTTPQPELTYSNLSFDVKQSSAPDSHPSRANRNPSWTSKNPQEAKIAIDRRQAYLDKLTPEARERAEENKKWEKANLQASGTKVMDDPKKIEKALKRQKKEKKKRKHAWDERVKTVEKLQEDRQKKRKENIEKRKEQIRDKRHGVKAKGNLKSKPFKKSVKGF